MSIVKLTRHKWSEPSRFQYKTERECLRCGLMKVTQKPTDRLAWIEFWSDGERIPSEATPACAGVKSEGATQE